MAEALNVPFSIPRYGKLKEDDVNYDRLILKYQYIQDEVTKKASMLKYVL